MTSGDISGADPICEARSAGICTITLNRPHKLNALDTASLDQLTATISAAEDDDAVRVIILCGAGKAFCAGADRATIAELRGEHEIRRHAQRMANAQLALLQATTPTIAAVHGYALGAGCGLVTACDLAIASPDAVFGYPEVANGILPAIVTPALVQAVGQRQAFSLLASARRITAAEAAALGLVSYVAKDDALEEAHALGAQLAKAPRGLLVRLRDLVGRCAGEPVHLAMETAREANATDRIERVAAAE
jgi:enoyl-CoA hydratase/carnithine racemase